MIAYIKCSFRSSHGYKIGKYDIGSHELLLSRPGELPLSVKQAFDYEWRKFVVLAGDKNDECILGIFGLGDSYEKYLSIIFYGRNELEDLLSIFYYICTNKKAAFASLNKSVLRISERSTSSKELEYYICSESFSSFIHASTQSGIGSKYSVKKELFACYLETTFADYKFALCNCFHIDRNYKKNIYENTDFDSDSLPMLKAIDIDNYYKQKYYIVLLILLVVSITVASCSYFASKQHTSETMVVPEDEYEQENTWG